MQTTQDPINNQTMNQIPTDTVTKTNNSSSKTFIIIILLLLLIVAGLFVYLNLTPKTVEAPEPIIQSEEQLEQILASQPAVEQTGLSPIGEDIRPVVEGEANLFITSPKRIYEVGEFIEATVLLSTSINPDGIEYQINYNPKLLDSVTVTAINSFGSHLTHKVNQEQGTIKAIFLREPGEMPSLEQSLPLLQITGKTLSTGTVALSFDKESTDIAGLGGQSILSNTYNLSIEVE